jgi:Bacterial membrane protein YfhO
VPEVESTDRRSGRDLARRAAPTAFFVLLALVLFAPSVVGGKVLAANDLLLGSPPFVRPPDFEASNFVLQDPPYVFYPDQLEVREALRSGRLPLWSAGVSAGRPLLAAQQSAPFFPLNWIGDVFPYWESLVWIAVLKLTLAALGTFLLCRALGLGFAPALLGAVAFAFGAYLIGWLSHPHANAYVTLPWLFLMGERLCREGGALNAAGLAAAVGLAFLSGHPQSAMIVGLAAAAWVVYRLVALRSARAVTLGRAGLAVGAGLLGLALAAVMLVPLAEALGQSYESSRGGPAQAARFGLALFFPEYWGRSDRATPIDDAPVLGGEASNFFEHALYIGALPLVLAVAGLFAHRLRGPQLFFAGLAVAALLVALDSGPITEVVRDLPVLSSAQLNRVLVLASFAGAVLAGFGLEHLLRGPTPVRRRMVVAAALVAFVPPLAVLAAHPSSLEELGDGVRRLAGRGTPLTGEIIALASVLRWLILATVGVAVIAAIRLWPKRATLLAGVAVAVTAVDLLVMGFGWQPSIDRSEASPPEPRAVRVMRDMTAEGGRVAGDGDLAPNTATRWGLRDARGHDLPVVERHQRLWAAAGGGFFAFPQWTRVQPSNPNARKLLDLFAVRAYLSRTPWFPGLPIAYQGPDGAVAGNPTALPRAFVAYGWNRSSSMDQSLFTTVGASARQSRDQPAIETSESPPAGVPDPASTARIVEDTDTSVTVDLTARAAGHLVLLDTYYPGWRAEVDGRDTEIRPAMAAFRAVKVPAGQHRVRFTYRPASVYAGGVITLLAIAALVATALIGRRRRALS